MLAWGIDFALMSVLFGAVMVLLARDLLTHLWALVGEFALTMALNLYENGGKDVEGAARDSAESVSNGVVLQVIIALLLVAFLQFLYQFLSLAVAGRTIGKAIADVQVRGVSSGVRARPFSAFRRAALVTLFEFGLFCTAVSLMIDGNISAGRVVLWTGILLFWGNVAFMFAPSRRSLADRLSNTRVARTLVHQAIARGAVGAASAGGGVLRDSGRQALQSNQAQQAAAFGQVGLDHGRRLGQDGLRLGRQAGQEARRRWNERRAPLPPSAPNPHYSQPPGYGPYPPTPGSEGQPPMYGA